MYVYGYPLVYSLRELAGFAEGHGSLPVSAPWNEFGYARELLGPETTFVSRSNDTLYPGDVQALLNGDLLKQLKSHISRAAGATRRAERAQGQPW